MLSPSFTTPASLALPVIQKRFWLLRQEGLIPGGRSGTWPEIPIDRGRIRRLTKENTKNVFDGDVTMT
jgi:hypothetical protein